MKNTMTASFCALAPFFRAMRTSLGAQATTTRVSVPGGLYMQKLGVRNTNDIDVVLKGDTPINRKRLRNDIAKSDKAFTINFEKICGVTYRDPAAKDLVAIDIIDEGVTGYMPRGARLDQLGEMEIPWPEDHEFIKMKILSAGEREDTNKGIQDLDDVKSLLKRKVVSMEYGDEEERAAITNSLNKSLLSYLERESEWSAAEWKAKLGLD